MPGSLHSKLEFSSGTYLAFFLWGISSARVVATPLHGVGRRFKSDILHKAPQGQYARSLAGACNVWPRVAKMIPAQVAARPGLRPGS